MPPFDYHPPTDSVPMPKIKQAAPSAMQRHNLRNTGPDSTNTAPAADDAPRVIFTDKLVNHERETLMPYTHSEKVAHSAPGGDTTNTSSSSSSTKGSKKEDGWNSSEGTDVQIDAGELSLPPSMLEGDEESFSSKEYVKTFIPGLAFDKNPWTTVKNSRAELILGAALAYVILLLFGFGAWGAARIVDLGFLLIIVVYVLFITPSSSFSLLMTNWRKEYHDNPTLWQSAIINILLLYLVTFALDMTSLLVFALIDVADWFVIVTQIIFLAAKHWARVDLFDYLPAKWIKEEKPPPKAAPKAEVFHVAENTYTYGQAADVCASVNAKLANYDQIEHAYQSGGEWCGYGWSEGQMAYFPTQKATWTALQKSTDPTQRLACGRPGVNGGFMTNPDMKFGVNCFGVKPAQAASDVITGSLQIDRAAATGGKGGSGAPPPPKFTRDQLRLQSFNRAKWSKGAAHKGAQLP